MDVLGAGGRWMQPGRRKVVEAEGIVNRCARRGGWPWNRALRFHAMVSILTISGMVAVHAKRAVFTALAGVPGVRSAEVELGRAVVDHDTSTTADALIEAVAIAGCTVTGMRPERRLPLR